MIFPVVMAGGLAALSTPAPRAQAGPLEALVSPGPLAEAHADVEADCAKCHRAFEPAAQAGLCLDCHEEVAADRSSRTGFHGRSPAASGVECRSCHAEHRGREAQLVSLEAASFDHAATDRPLRGAHASVPCSACHTEGKKWREAPSDCAGCHARSDPHEGRLGKDCASCHGEAGWKETRFDHAKTRFPLEGEHAKVACASCHPGEHWSGVPRACGSCHALNDAHRGRLGEDCASCHVVTGWKTERFDHGKTRFPLAGAHARARCEACHGNGSFAAPVARDCLSCHRSDDVHEGRFGAACEQCHGESAFEPARFDHDRATRFPLRGRHRDAGCEDCHAGGVLADELDGRCVSCHAKLEPHRQQLGDDCAKCHNELGWRERVAFDHDLARFPLLGLHAVAACEQCHTSAAFRGTERSCIGCHAKEDRHERRLGAACETCHNANAWSLWRFDHDAQTAFALHGAHRDTACESCHTGPLDGSDAKPLPSRCAVCHAADDPHRGGFGTRCESCHVESGWSELSIVR
jgi:hypothetical protein